MEISKTEIGNALTSADENHILATANDIYDETQQAYQSDINAELKEGKQDKHRFILDVANYSFEDLLEACKKNYDIIALVEGVHVQINTYYVEENNTVIHLGGRVNSLEETHTTITDVNVCAMEFFATQDEISYNLHNILLKGGGKGTQFLADDGQYKSLPEFEDISNLQASIDKLQQAQDDLDVEIQNKQDNLVSGINIKTINGTSLLGSGDVVVSGDASGSVDEGRLYWSQKDIQDNTTLLDNLYRDTIGNKLAFCDPNSISVEYSQDNGSIWENYNLSDDGKTVLVTPVVGVSTLKLGKRDDKSDGDQLRITIDAQTANLYFRIKKILIKLSDAPQEDKDNGYPTHCTISFQRNVNYNTDTWETYKDTAVIGGNAWVSLEASGLPVFGNTPASHIRQIRLTFYMPNGCGAYKCRVRNITFIAQSITSGGSGLAKTGHLYEIDVKQNATFPNAIKSKKLITNGGKSTQVVKGDGSLEEESALAVASAIDAEHAEEADYAGVADKAETAEKLANARTISLSGGASGSVSFDGSKNVSIPVTSLQENALVWSTNDIQNNTTIMDSIFRDTIGNRLAFCNPAAITIENSQDGGVTWVSIDNDADKTKLVTPVLGDTNFTIGGSGTPPNRDLVQTRVTIDAITADLYFAVNKILIETIGVTGVDSNAGKPTFCKIEYQTYSNYGTDTWTTYKDIEVIGQPGWNSISTNGLPNFGYASPPHIRLIRFTFYKPNGCGQYIGRLSHIAFLASKLTQGGNTFSKTGHIYGIDVNQNVTFPANIKASDFNGVNIAVNNNIKGKTLNIGLNTTLSNSGTAAIGENCSATNPYAIAMGYKAVSSRYYSTAIGTAVEASSNYQTVIGKYNATSTHAFVIGWGTADAKKNIFSVDTSGNVYGTKFITSGGTNQQVVLGDGSLRPISELSPITDADAEILLDNHIHSVDVSASGDDVNINVIESTKNGNAWETTEKNIPIPVATQETAGMISATDKQKIDAINYEDNTLFVGDGTNGTLSIGYDSSKASADMRVFRDRYSTIHVTSYNDTTGGSIAVMESNGGKGRMEVNGDQFAELVLSGAGQVRATLTKENEDGTNIKTIIDAAEGITAPKLATIGGTSEQILLGDGTLITFDELKAKLGLI